MEIATSLPFCVVFFLADINDFWYRFIMMMDPFRIYMQLRMINYIDAHITREVLYIINNAIFLVLACTSYIAFFENEATFPEVLALFTFQEALFFVMTSVSVVGYGCYAVTTQSRVFLIFFLTIVFTSIPDQSTKILNLISSRSKYERLKYKATEQIPHIVLIGHVTPSSMFNFLQEYFHEDHGDYQRNCVVMMPKPPDADTEMKLMHKKYVSTVYYLQGNPLEKHELKRCLIEKAKTVVILSDKLADDANQSDTHTILQAMVIRNYLSELRKTKGKLDTTICMQLLKKESITHYELSINKEDTKNDHYVCIESMKLSLLAKSCLCPGLVVLITNLIKSSMDPPKKLESYDSKNWRWLYDYWSGKKYEIYRVEIPSSY